MKSELHLFIIWSNAQPKKTEIIKLISDRFEILKTIEINWPVSDFHKNMTRFYGVKLPKGSYKERECGAGPLTLVVVLDHAPNYDNRDTTRGVQFVNTNMFDAKAVLRNLVGGDSLVHGTNTEKETLHDLVLLIGYTPQDFLQKYQNIPDTLNNSLIGTNGWKNLEELFFVLNNTIEYTVLRNFEYLPEKFKSAEHGDIDFLCYNPSELAHLINAERVFQIRYRVHYKTTISGEDVYFDFRYVGDNYYDKNWELDILSKRILNNSSIYIPDDENYRYSLLYHALVHKPVMSQDYKAKLDKLFPGENCLESVLEHYMQKKGYEFVAPNDFSVYVNQKISDTKISIKHQLINMAKTFKRTVKNLLKK